MGMNKQKGNMYGFVTHTWNPIKGKCSHDCSYCYMKRFPQKPIRLVENELKDDLGEGNFIFVGSSTDMWAKNIPNQWIDRTLNHCIKYPKNTYLFQSKNPSRFIIFKDKISKLQCVLGTTLETNIRFRIANAPKRYDRVKAMQKDWMKRKMVTIEPIMDFDVGGLVKFIDMINPEFVNIGADSKGHNLPEPSWEKVEKLIKELKKFTKVNLKDNLKRLKTTKEEKAK